MLRSVRWLTLLIVLTACRETRSESERDGAPDVATRTDTARVDVTEPGLEFEAPRLIPAVRAQITEIGSPEGATKGNLMAFKSGVGTLVNAMKADLNHVGVTDSGEFFALSDSVTRKIGGGASDLPDISPEEAPQAAGQVERLIGIYEERMRTAAR
jgi:hypothetical protein